MAGESDAADPTELAGIAEMRTESVQAWSLDEADEDYPLTGSWEDPERRLTPRRITILGVAASLVAVAAVGVLAVYILRRTEASPAPVVVVATPSSSPVAAQPPAPPPVTITSTVLAAPSAVQKTPRPPSIAVYDAALIANLRSRRWIIWDESNLISQGHLVCKALQQGTTAAGMVLDLEHGDPPSTPDQAESFVSTVMATYPNCP